MRCLATPELLAEAQVLELRERRCALELAVLLLDVPGDGTEGVGEAVRAHEV